MTWRLLATSPSLETTKPVPNECSVRTETTEGVETAAISAGVRWAEPVVLATGGCSAGGVAVVVGLQADARASGTRASDSRGKRTDPISAYANRGFGAPPVGQVAPLLRPHDHDRA